jgi:hypothetical protein
MAAGERRRADQERMEAAKGSVNKGHHNRAAELHDVAAGIHDRAAILQDAAEVRATLSLDL